MKPTISIGKEKAIKLSNTNWWKDSTMTSRNIAMFQIFVSELCMNFSDFHCAVEDAIGRPVFTHSFAVNYDGIVSELLGESRVPSADEIISLLPANCRNIISASDINLEVEH